MTAHQEIYVLGKTLKLRHTEKGFKTCLDSVMLAAACPAKAEEQLLDMGCGVGGAGLCVLARVAGVQLTGVELQADQHALACDNATQNGFAAQVNFIHQDILTYKNGNFFNHIICNPPYLEGGAHMRSPTEAKAIAMGGVENSPSPPLGGGGNKAALVDWVNIAYKCLKPYGSLTFIYPAEKTDKLIQALGPRFGGVEICPLWPKENIPAKRVIIRAKKDRNSPATLLNGIILHNGDGTYMEKAEDILRYKGVLL